MKIKCAIIEDEPLAMERITEYVNKVPFLEIVGTFHNALEGLTFLNQHKLDLLFLDINMDELSGIQLLESTSLSCQVILTTAYDEYALKGYELNVTDYLLKPYSFERFLKAVNKVKHQASQPVEQTFEFVFIKTEGKLEKVMLHDILFVEGMGDYRRIHLESKRIMTLQTFTELAQLIPESIACRVHKSYMVAPAKIDHIERGRIRIGKHFIPISETYKKDFFDRLKT